MESSLVREGWWGREQRVITYEAEGGGRVTWCLGHGSVPVLPAPDPLPGRRPAITWHSTRTVREGGQHRTRFGFAVLDLQPDRIETAYVDDDGHVAHTETIA